MQEDLLHHQKAPKFEQNQASNHDMRSENDSQESQQDYEDSLGTVEAQMIYHPFKDEHFTGTDSNPATIADKDQT